MDDALRGTGAGKRLVEAAIARARVEGLKVIPLCPFAKATIEHDPSLQDVLAQQAVEKGHGASARGSSAGRTRAPSL